MKVVTQNIVIEFFVILFLHVNESLSLPSNINQDNALNPYKFEIIPLPFSNQGTKLSQSIANENELKWTKEAWRWSLGIVHYYVDVSSYDYLVSYQIRTTMNILESSTCIKFSPLLVKPEGKDKYIHITNQNKERNCNHEPWFKDTGEIVLVLGYDCLSNVEIMHSLLHALGLKDAVTHPQRDKYIRVIWSNIQPAYRHLYNIQEDPSVTVEYDPMSVMHFSDRDFTVNGQATIEPVVSGLLINPSESLSALDKLRLRLLFGHVCNKREVHNVLKTCRNSFHRKDKSENGMGAEVETLNDNINKTDIDNNEVQKENAAIEATKSDTGTVSDESDGITNHKDETINEENGGDKKDGEKNESKLHSAIAENNDVVDGDDDSTDSHEEVTVKTENKKED